MWVVRNVLRGTIYVNDLDIRIPPKSTFDLDTVGRRRAEASAQLRLAFEEGYLQNVSKGETDQPGGAFPLPAVGTAASLPFPGESELASQIREIQRLVGQRTDAEGGKPLAAVQTSIARDLQGDQILRQLSELKQAVRGLPATLAAPPPPPSPPPAPSVDADALAAAVGAGVSKVEQELAELRNALRTPLPAPSAPPPPPPAPAADVSRVERELAELKEALRAREAAPPSVPPVDPDALAAAVSSGVGREIEHLRRSIADESARRETMTSQFADMRAALVGDLKDVMRELAARRAGAAPAAGPLAAVTDAELKLRLAALEQQERTVARNFDQAGRQEAGPGGASDTASELADAL